ncbi:MAG: hypothetical protein JXA82_08795 [Sedimentisphaerales bacterium]|nr:hypothetical protein [Sedimentisphaerales bacterium]
MAEIDPLAEAFCQIRDPRRMKRFFDEIFTPAERHDLAMRWELMHRLRAGQAQRQIAADLGISLCKITRGAKILKDKKSVTRNLLEEQSHD